MSELILSFEKPGLYTSIQDAGRKGVQDQGIPIGGALDKDAMYIANRLVGNPEDNAVLEVTMVGPEILFEGSGQIAITGAEMEPTINGERVSMYKTLDITSGDRLNLDHAINGCRSYIAIGGEWLTPKWLGSQSAPANLMRNDDFPSTIKAGSSIMIQASPKVQSQTYPKNQRPLYTSCYIIRVVTGPEFESFNISHIQNFFDSIFVVDTSSNRMGYRLTGMIRGYVAQTEVISSGIVPGTVQITNAGSPVVLMADAQTTGGYPRIANVILEDLDIMAQMKPGDELRFMLISLEDL